MALASVGYALAITLIDQGGNKSVLRYEVVPTDHPTAEAVALLTAQSLDAVTNSAVKGFSISEIYDDSAVDFGTGENENIALITAKLVGTPLKYTNIRVPNPIPGMFVAASGPDFNVVDPTNVPLQTYLSLFETGGGLSISDGEFLRDSAGVGNFTGKRIHRGSRKG